LGTAAGSIVDAIGAIGRNGRTIDEAGIGGRHRQIGNGTIAAAGRGETREADSGYEGT